MKGLENSDSAVKNEISEELAKIPEKPAFVPRVLDSYEVARFWSRVEVRKRDQCWPWRYGQAEDGYGEFRFNDGNPELAHRVAYRIKNGGVPFGAVVRHTCDNRVCCNPSHLLSGTHADNVADRVERNRSARGEENGRAKLTEKQVRQILLSPLSAEYFAKRFDVDVSTVSAIKKRKNWKHLDIDSPGGPTRE